MRKLRQKYDNIHKTVLAKENELEILKVSLIKPNQFRNDLK